MRFPRLFEFEDFPWLPDFLRDATTDYLRFAAHVGRLYDPVIPLLNTAMEKLGEPQILDCCSGSGGPWLSLYERLRSVRPQVRLQMCDFFPNEKARQFWKGRFDGKVNYLSRSIDAKNIPSELNGFRTFFTSFHHFMPEDARNVLKDAVSKHRGIGIFECTQRGSLAFLWMVFVPVVLWVVTPLLRPFSWRRLAFTYLLPIIPLIIAWDGLVSCLRTYSPRELNELIQSLETDYDWQVGEVTGPLSPVPVTYLIGLPRQRLKR